MMDFTILIGILLSCVVADDYLKTRKYEKCMDVHKDTVKCEGLLK